VIREIIIKADNNGTSRNRVEDAVQKERNLKLFAERVQRVEKVQEEVEVRKDVTAN
jgi:pyruvate/oxaloacetate carboxyltransferase